LTRFHAHPFHQDWSPVHAETIGVRHRVAELIAAASIVAAMTFFLNFPDARQCRLAQTLPNRS
jgi:hypothetical protein